MWSVLRIRIWDPGSDAFWTPGSGMEKFGSGIQWWAKLLRLLTVNSLSYFVKIKY
jgi:hypothetical protein